MEGGEISKSIIIIVIVLIIIAGVGVYVYFAKQSLLPVEREILENIPHIYHKPANWNGKSIIFVHGLGGKKESWIDDMEAFEELGYATLAFDLPYHGERGNFQLDKVPEVIMQGSDEIVTIAETLKNDGATEVYLISVSLGSIISGVALGKTTIISRAVLLLPSADLEYVLTQGELAKPSPSKPTVTVPDKETLKKIDPMYFLPKYTGRIQFHIGKKDTLLTPEAGVFAYNMAILAEEREIIWHNVGHSMSLKLYFNYAKEFFERAEPKVSVSQLVTSVKIPPKGGNGICDPGETWESSPFDCKKKILLIGFQLHIEEIIMQKYYDSDRNLFMQYADILDRLAKVFEKHGAKLSIQTEKNFANADVKFGRYILQELRQRGHGIGVQSHLGHHMKELNLQTDQQKLQYTLGVKQAVINALGWEPTNLGGGFEMDNVNLLGVVEGGAGFTSMTAVEKPYYRQVKKPPKWMHPWILPPTQMSNLADPEWLAHDPSGSLVYIPGWYMSEIFEIDCRKDESSLNYATQSLYNALEDADENFINVWWCSSHLYQSGGTEEQTQRVINAYDKWFTEVVDPLVEQGKVKWMTFDEIAQIYLKWEKERCIYTSAIKTTTTKTASINPHQPNEINLNINLNQEILQFYALSTVVLFINSKWVNIKVESIPA